MIKNANTYILLCGGYPAPNGWMGLLKIDYDFQNLKSGRAYKDFFLEFIGIDAQ